LAFDSELLAGWKICGNECLVILCSSKPKVKKKPKDVILAPTGGNILPFFWADVEGRREYGLLKMPEPFAPKKGDAY
jgi:hypothetical protein